MDRNESMESLRNMASMSTMQTAPLQITSMQKRKSKIQFYAPP